jgi:hypothetical protein
VVKDFLQGHQRTALTPTVLMFSIIAMAFTLLLGILAVLRGHAKAANEGHLKTGQRE